MINFVKVILHEKIRRKNTIFNFRTFESKKFDINNVVNHN